MSVPMTRRTMIRATAASAATLPLLRGTASAQTPSTTDTIPYVCHGGRLLATVPAGWVGLPGIQDLLIDMRGGDFIHGQAAMGDSLDDVAQASAEEMDANANGISTTEVGGLEARKIEGGTSPVLGMPATRFVVAYPEPFLRWGVHMTHATIDIAPNAVDAIVPTISLDTSAVTPHQYVSTILDMAQLNAYFTEELDWDTLQVGIDTAVTDMESAHAYLRGPVRDAFKAAGDAHTHFIGEDVAADATPNATPVAVALPQVTQTADGVTVISIPDADAGYQNEYMAAIRTGLVEAAERGDCGVIVDLRQNFGGSVFPMVSGLSPLLPAGDVFGFQYPGQANPYMMTLAQVMENAGATSELPASELDLQTMPVAVLFGGGTASSGELTAISFVGRERTRSFGMESAGYTTANTTFFLLDGWEMNLATSLMVDREGTAYGGKLQPVEVVEYADDQIGTADDPVIAAASDWLATQSCAPVGTPAATPVT